MKIPNPNYLAPASFGTSNSRNAISLDGFNFPRLDLIKVDVEGMELDVLAGAAKCIETHRPVLLIEAIKVDGAKLRALLESLNYSAVNIGINVLAIHKNDACLAHLETVRPKPS